MDVGVALVMRMGGAWSLNGEAVVFEAGDAETNPAGDEARPMPCSAAE